MVFAIGLIVPWTANDSARQNTYAEAQAIVEAFWQADRLPAPEATGPVAAIPVAMAPRTNPAPPPQPTAIQTTQPRPARRLTPAPAPPTAPAMPPALEPGPVQSPAGYSATVPFDRALRIPLQTPRLSTQQAALIIGIAVTGAALVSVGVPGRRDGD
jgi:hypothetical protein